MSVIAFFCWRVFGCGRVGGSTCVYYCIWRGVVLSAGSRILLYEDASETWPLAGIPTGTTRTPIEQPLAINEASWPCPTAPASLFPVSRLSRSDRSTSEGSCRRRDPEQQIGSQCRRGGSDPVDPVLDILRHCTTTNNTYITQWWTVTCPFHSDGHMGGLGKRRTHVAFKNLRSSQTPTCKDRRQSTARSPRLGDGERE